MTAPGFWRGYFVLAASACAASTTMQIDLAMVARSGGSAAGAFAVLMRMTLLDVALTVAVASVAGVMVAHATAGNLDDVVGRICVLVATLGGMASVFGFFAYPSLLAELMGAEEAGPFIGQPIFWLVAATPFRMLANAESFVLHALGQGAVVFRLKLVEVPSKLGLNLLFIDALGFGLAGCMIAGFVIAVASSLWFWLRLRERGAWSFCWPNADFARAFLWPTFWESHRILSPQAAMLLSLALFSSTQFNGYNVERLDAFAAGQTFMLFVLGPMAALTRFLAMRLPVGAAQKETRSLIQSLQSGARVVAVGALLLFICGDRIGGSLYHQHGPWWSTFVAMLSLSLPIRYFGSVLRGVMLARGKFSKQTLIDAVAQWIAAPLFLCLGLFINDPPVAYLSIILPEIMVIFLILVALERSRDGAFNIPLPSERPIQ